MEVYMKNLPIKLKVFLISMYLLTVVSIGVMIKTNTISIYIPRFTDILFFAAFFALAESFVVNFRNIGISASFAIHLASVILFKPFSALLIILIGYLFRVVKLNGKYVHVFNTPIYKTMYNYGVFMLPTLYGGYAYKILGGKFTTVNLWSQIHTIIAFSIVYFFLNTLIMSVLFSIIHQKSVSYFFKGNTKISLLSIAIMAPFGIILAYIFDRYKFAGVISILLPIFLARYTFALYIETKTQYVQTVDTLMRAMEARDKYTEGHSQRVAEISALIAKELKYTDIQIEKLHMASLLHDVGKIGIDDNILNKPGRLTMEEYEIIKSHPEIGYNILKDIKYLEPILHIVRNHHERYDGKGYPDAKTPEELGLDVFIVQLADTIDAMATDRPYRKALTEEEVIDEINKFSGAQFHPKVVQAYLNIVEKQKEAV
jgi:putative nucleotidyltransferase with HDIG domain